MSNTVMAPVMSAPLNAFPRNGMRAVAVNDQSSYQYNGVCATSPMKPLAKLPIPMHYGFVLERHPDQALWGLTLSLHEKVLIVGHLRGDIVQNATKAARASYTRPAGINISPHPLAFLHAFPVMQEAYALKPGDIILSINGRHTHMFPTLTAVTDYVRCCCVLCIMVLRVQESPPNPTPGKSFDTVRHVYMSLQKNKLMHFLGSTMHVHGSPPTTTKLDSPIPQRKPPPVVINPLFNIPFGPSTAEDSEDGLRSKEFLRDINAQTFPIWLADRKQQWRKTWRKQQTSMCTVPQQPVIIPEAWRNPLFRDDKGQFLSYEDNWEFQAEDGSGGDQYLSEITSFNFFSWLNKRKEMWSENYQPHVLDYGPSFDDDEDDSPITVLNDFWSQQGYSSFDEWQLDSKTRWKLQYSWNIRKRKQIKEEAEEVVSFPSPGDDNVQFEKWLSVRKNQWRIQRRKRQRQFLLETLEDAAATSTDVPESPRCVVSPSKTSSGDMVHIDALLEEELVRKRLMEKAKNRFDLAFVFDARLGACDDVIAHCMRFLHPSEHGKLLTLSKTTSGHFQEREDMWQQLCPQRWSLPRKPRKPWHEMYISKIRTEEQEARKRSDETLNMVAMILFKGDHLQKVEKLVNGAQKLFGFDINYTSGVICERNAIVNLAVIHRRAKVVKWLVDTKEGLDLETFDRGGFTPLMNAAWAGDRVLVRLLLGSGCDRTKIGTGHYTQPLALPDFKGLTPEGWARKKGYEGIANLIRLGL
jgi:Ankyrin repeats (3 copies)